MIYRIIKYLKLKRYNSNFTVTKEMVKDGELIKSFIPDIVYGNFICAGKGLTTLKNCPIKVAGIFDCSYNEITSLKYISNYIGRDLKAYSNKIKNLKYFPEKLKGDFNCDDNLITSLKGLPKRIYGDFYCGHNKLTSLKYCPEIVDNYFHCGYNQLTSLEFAPKKLENSLGVTNNNAYLQIEEDLIKEGYTDYWPDLYNHCKFYGYEVININTWPTEFINTLPEEDKILLSSNKGIIKYDL